VAQRSRWQAVLLKAGGLSAALSEESMRRLKYWLQVRFIYCFFSLILIHLFTFFLKKKSVCHSAHRCPNPHPPTLSPTSKPSLVPPPYPHRAACPSRKNTCASSDVRRDIVHTIRQVVDVVSKYAGGALPELARGEGKGVYFKVAAAVGE